MLNITSHYIINSLNFICRYVIDIDTYSYIHVCAFVKTENNYDHSSHWL